MSPELNYEHYRTFRDGDREIYVSRYELNNYPYSSKPSIRWEVWLDGVLEYAGGQFINGVKGVSKLAPEAP